jgi:hypothetical protein
MEQKGKEPQKAEGHQDNLFDPKQFQQSTKPTLSVIVKEVSDQGRHMGWSGKDRNGNWGGRRS